MNTMGDCFIRKLHFSKNTFRLKKGVAPFDQSTEGVLAKLSTGTINVLEQCMRKPTELKLTEKSGSASIITISMDYIPVVKEIPPIESLNNMGQLRVDILGAADLPAADRNGYSDPYCKFELNKQSVFSTKVQKKTLHPAWNESFEVAVRSRIASTLTAQVYHSSFGEKAILLGSTEIDLDLLEPFVARELVLSLDGKSGALRMRLLFRP